MPTTDAAPNRRLAQRADRTIELGEQVVYITLAVVLLAAAVTVLVSAAHDLVTSIDDGALKAATLALDGLLLVFIFVELLGAVRATIAERSLVAEPFLVVGIIASIKAIVVSSLDASKASGAAFDDLITEIGVLAGVIILLAASAWLVRRKEREPAEAEPDGPGGEGLAAGGVG